MWLNQDILSTTTTKTIPFSVDPQLHPLRKGPRPLHKGWLDIRFVKQKTATRLTFFQFFEKFERIFFPY